MNHESFKIETRYSFCITSIRKIHQTPMSNEQKNKNSYHIERTLKWYVNYSFLILPACFIDHLGCDLKRPYERDKNSSIHTDDNPHDF